MLEADHLELQENSPEPITRPKLKRLILEYLQGRTRQEVIQEALSQRDEGFNDPFIKNQTGRG